MQGAAQALFVPLALAVGFAMIASYILSSTFVPVLVHLALEGPSRRAHGRTRLRLAAVRPAGANRDLLSAGFSCRVYLVLAGAACCSCSAASSAAEIFPQVDAGQFQFRLKAPTGTRIEQTEAITQEALRFIGDEVRRGRRRSGHLARLRRRRPLRLPDQHRLSVDGRPRGVGDPGRPQARNGARRGSEGPASREAPDAPAAMDRREVEERRSCRRNVAEQPCPDLRLSFEPADIVNEVMSFGSPSPIEVMVCGPKLADNRAHAEKVYRELAEVPRCRRPALCAVPRLPDRRDRGRPREDRTDGSNRIGRRQSHHAVHLVEPLHRAELLARSGQRHRLPGSGRGAVRACPFGQGSGTCPRHNRTRRTRSSPRRGSGQGRHDARADRPLQHAPRCRHDRKHPGR